jgi:hypothetical protein
MPIKNNIIALLRLNKGMTPEDICEKTRKGTEYFD